MARDYREDAAEKVASDFKFIAVLWGMVVAVLVIAFAMGWFFRDKMGDRPRCEDPTPLMDVTWKGKKTRIVECGDGSVRAEIAPFEREIVTR
jgi:hypothetical protein